MCPTWVHGSLFLVRVTGTGAVQTQMALPSEEGMFPWGQYGKSPEVPGDKAMGGWSLPAFGGDAALHA